MSNLMDMNGYAANTASKPAAAAPAVADTAEAAKTTIREATAVSFARTTNGGYPIALFKSQPSELFLCMVCSEVLRDPLQCSNGHSGCRHCLSQCSLTTKDCPMRCGATVDDASKLVSNRIVACIIDDFEVQCPTNVLDKYQQEQSQDEVVSPCPWVGKLATASRHIETCENALVQCPIIDCVALIRRPALARHLEECDHRLLSCTYCAAQVKAHEMQEHTDQCDLRPVPCPNWCLQTKRPRLEASVCVATGDSSADGVGNSKWTLCLFRDLVAHLNVCPEAIVPCGYAELGCTASVRRKELPVHMQDLTIHWPFLLSSATALRQRVRELEDKQSESLAREGKVYEGALDASNLSRRFSFEDKDFDVQLVGNAVKIQSLKSTTSPILVRVSGHVDVYCTTYRPTRKVEVPCLIVRLGVEESFNLVADCTKHDVPYQTYDQYCVNTRRHNISFRLEAHTI